MTGSAPVHVVLVGLMATGKSTVARILGARLGRTVLDSDEYVEQVDGRTVREIWEQDGESAFRRLEAEALRQALGRGEPAVVAAAGGVVLDRSNRELLRGPSNLVVWLRADPAVLAERTDGGDDHRPLLDGDVEGRLARMHADRTPLYAEVADVIVDVDDRDPEQVADAVEAAL